MGLRKLVGIFAIVLSGFTSTAAQDQVVKEVLPGQGIDRSEIIAQCSAVSRAFISPWERNRPPQLEPRFDWSVPARYGIDENKNGIPDLPNTRDYVLNQDHSDGAECACTLSKEECAQQSAKFKVTLDATHTRAIDGVYRKKSVADLTTEYEAIGCQNSRALAQEALDQAVTPAPVFWYNSSDGTDGPVFNWVVRTQSGRFVSRGGGKEMQLCLPEGGYRVSLRARGLGGTPDKVLTRTITVEDHFIALLGDSYGAGEGVPERSFQPKTSWERVSDGRRFSIRNYFESGLEVRPAETLPAAQWADPGSPIPMRSVELFADHSEGKLKQSIQIIDTNRIPTNQWDSRNRIFWDHYRSHRSSFTHASQAALAIEEADPRSSVTFVNLAQTGATISKGVLGHYNGTAISRDYDAKFLPFGVSKPIAAKGSSSGTPIGCWLEPRLGMCPQMLELESLITTREIDDLYMSIGGNDAGFAHVIGMLMVAHRGDSKDYRPTKPNSAHCDGENDGYRVTGTVCSTLRALKSGKWRDLNMNPYEWGTLGFNEIQNITGLDHLYKDYEKLNERLDTLKDQGQLSDRVTLLGPPFFGRIPYDMLSWTEDRFGFGRFRAGTYKGVDMAYCYADIMDAPTDVEFHPREFKFADWDVYRPLKAEMLKAAQTHDWNFITQNEADIAFHGMCGNKPYRFYGDYSPTHPVDLSQASQEGRRWYRTSPAGKALQLGDGSNNSGMFHPNEYGYAYVRDLILDRIPERWDIPGYSIADENDTYREAEYLGSAPEPFDVMVNGVDDVQTVKIFLNKGKIAIVDYATTRPEDTAACVAIAAHAQYGEVFATNSRNLAVDLWDGRRQVLEDRQLESPSSYDFGDSCGDNFTPQKASIPENQRTMMQYGKARLVIPATQAPRRVTVSFSHPRNVLYDPVTGRGDVRGRIARPRIVGRAEIKIIDAPPDIGRVQFPVIIGSD